jgi:AAA family ATP:ADP antiporter
LSPEAPTTLPPAGGNRTALLAISVATAGGLSALEVAGLAARDGLFLSQLPASQLPEVMVAAAGVALAGSLGLSHWLRNTGPERVAPLALLLSAVTLTGIAFLSATAPAAAAVLLYLQVTGISPVVASAFWSVVNERFDPYEAKRVVARMAAAAALGAVVGGITAERLATLVAMPALIFALAAICAACALATRRIGASHHASDPEGARSSVGSPGESGLKLLGRIPLLRQMATLMLLVAIVEILVEYALKVEASKTFHSDADLVRFFAGFYTVCGLVAFGIQSLAGDRFLRRFGLAGAVAMLPASVALTASLGAGFAKLWTAALARAAETVASAAFFRTGFQLLYTPMARGVKRPAKVWVDVASGSIGEMLGAGIIFGLLFVLPDFPTGGVMLLAVAGCLGALLVVRRVHQGYVSQLTDSLRRGQVQIRAEDALDATTARTIVQSQTALDRSSLLERVRAFDADKASSKQAPAGSEGPPAGSEGPPAGSEQAARSEQAPARPSVARGDPTPQWIETLCSGDTQQIRLALAGGIDETAGATPERRRRLVAHVLPLLGNDAVARQARDFVRPLAPRAIGQLIDSLIDSEQGDSVQAQIAWILGGIDDPRAVRGLSRGLESTSFRVRVACGRALARIASRSPDLAPDRAHVHTRIERELEVDDELWARQAAREHESLGEGSVLLSRGALHLVSESLEHVFTLLAIAHDREPMASALAGLSSGNDSLRGTALELLESVLPSSLRRLLWPRLHAAPAPREAPRSRAQITEELLRTTTGQVLDRSALGESE